MKLTMVPAMSSKDIRLAVALADPETRPRYALVCDGHDWCIFVVKGGRPDGIELEIDFWEHDANEDGGGLFHYSNHDSRLDEYMVYTTSIRAIFFDEEKAIEVAQKLGEARRKFEEEVRAPFVAYQMSLMVAIA